jgi:hypothetical protein
MDSNDLDFMDGLAEITIDTTTTPAPLATDLSTSSVQSFVQRPIDPMYMHQMMYPPNFANAPMGPMPYTSGGPLEAFANGAYPTNFNSTKIELIDDLISPLPLEFKYCPDMNAVLHIGKCADCVHFGMHTLLPGNCINFINATTAHNDEIMEPLHDKIRKLTKDATTTTKSISELKDALKSSQERAATLSTQREDTFNKHDDLLMEYRLLQKKIKELEQQPPPALYRRAGSPSRNPHRHSPSRPGTRLITPYERPNSRRTTTRPQGRPAAPAPILQEPASDGDLVMASLPTSIHPLCMHATQSRVHNRTSTIARPQSRVHNRASTIPAHAARSPIAGDLRTAAKLSGSR